MLLVMLVLYAVDTVDVGSLVTAAAFGIAVSAVDNEMALKLVMIIVLVLLLTLLILLLMDLL